MQLVPLRTNSKKWWIKCNKEIKTFKESLITNSKAKVSKIKLETDKWCSSPWTKVGKMPVFFYLISSYDEHSAICNDESIISNSNASATTNAKINGNVPSTPMDAISRKNENGITYAQSTILTD